MESPWKRFVTTFAEPKTIASVSVVATANTRPPRDNSAHFNEFNTNYNKCKFRLATIFQSSEIKWFNSVSAQSFSNYFEGVLGVVRKSDRVSSIFNF
jgi:hypothetical protein